MIFCPALVGNGQDWTVAQVVVGDVNKANCREIGWGN